MKFVKIKKNLNIASALHSFTSGGIKFNVDLYVCVHIYVKHTQIHTIIYSLAILVLIHNYWAAVYYKVTQDKLFHFLYYANRMVYGQPGQDQIQMASELKGMVMTPANHFCNL